MEGLIEPIAETFLSLGWPGALILILMGALGYVFRELRLSERGRREDAQQMMAALNSLSKTNATVAAAMENASRSVEAAATNLAVNTRELEHLHDAVRDMGRRP